jgi:hypothetical protein
VKRLLLFLLIAVAVGCSQATTSGTYERISKGKKADSTIEMVTIQDVKNSFRPKYQIFRWDNQGDTTIVCDKGTIFKFKANSFYFPNGSKITLPIEFRIKEYYTNSEFISESLETSTKDELLETGGMFYVGVYSGNTELKLKDGYSYSIEVPRNENKNEMGLFYGVKKRDSIQRWTVSSSMINKSFKNYRNFNPALASPREVKTYYTESMNLIRDGVPYGYHTPKWRLVDTTQTVLSYIEKRLDSSQNLLKSTFKSKHNPVYKLTFSREGKILKVGPDYGKSSVYGTCVAKFLREMPPLYLKDYNDPKAYKVFNLSLSTKQNIEIIKIDADSLGAITTNDAGEFEPISMDYYILQSTELGFINCDRFYNIKEARTDYLVKLVDPSVTKVYLVFNDFKSMMYPTLSNSLGYVFQKIPIGQKVKIIGIKDNNGLAQISVRSAIIGRAALKLGDFKSVSLEEMKEIVDAI